MYIQQTVYISLCVSMCDFLKLSGSFDQYLNNNEMDCPQVINHDKFKHAEK